jgi:hypothetical protein
MYHDFCFFMRVVDATALLPKFLSITKYVVGFEHSKQAPSRRLFTFSYFNMASVDCQILD